MDDFRDRSPHTSPQKSNIPQTFDEIVISESGATPSVDSLEKIDLEFDIEDLPSFSDQSVSDIQPPLSPNFFFPQIPDTPVKDRPKKGKSGQFKY